VPAAALHSASHTQSGHWALAGDIGDEVKAGQAIGTLYTEKNAEQGILHFEIWKEFRSQNPKLWLHP